jgi:predicted Fe-Mo cluster-binding NifX family protein
MTNKITRIAFPSDDGETISRHFGKAHTFTVAVVQSDGEAVFEQRERRHLQPDHQHESPLFQLAEPASPHGSGPALGFGIFAEINDCQVLIAGGMGQPAYDRATAQGLEVILTGEKTIQAALEAYRAGRLASDMRRVHKH